MAANQQTIENLTKGGYEFGFFTDVEQELVPPGLNEDVIRLISAKKDEPEWLLE
jgi:Fe-S cluster assembly protein SufB